MNMIFFTIINTDLEKNSSTEIAAIYLINKITSALNDGRRAGAVFLDMSKAFDCVDHTILLEKLQHFGIRGIALEWFKSYFNDRQQVVTFCNNISTTKNKVTCGAPQGSILAPLLYLIYVNDLYRCLKKTTPVLFADDTTLISFGKDEHEVVDSLNNDLSEIQEWLICNKLTLNSGKTKFLLFGRRKTDHDFHVMINEKKIEQVFFCQVFRSFDK